MMEFQSKFEPGANRSTAKYFTQASLYACVYRFFLDSRVHVNTLIYWYACMDVCLYVGFFGREWKGWGLWLRVTLLVAEATRRGDEEIPRTVLLVADSLLSSNGKRSEEEYERNRRGWWKERAREQEKETEMKIKGWKDRNTGWKREHSRAHVYFSRDLGTQTVKPVSKKTRMPAPPDRFSISKYNSFLSFLYGIKVLRGGNCMYNTFPPSVNRSALCFSLFLPFLSSIYFRLPGTLLFVSFSLLQDQFLYSNDLNNTNIFFNRFFPSVLLLKASRDNKDGEPRGNKPTLQ